MFRLSKVLNHVNYYVIRTLVNNDLKIQFSEKITPKKHRRQFLFQIVLSKNQRARVRQIQLRRVSLRNFQSWGSG